MCLMLLCPIQVIITLCLLICVHVNLNSFDYYVNIYLVICSRSVVAAKLVAAQATALGKYEYSSLFECSDVRKRVDLYSQGGRSQLPTTGVLPNLFCKAKK